MGFGWRMAAAAAATALMLGSAAQAADLDVVPESDQYGYQEPSGEYGSIEEAPVEPRRRWREWRFHDRPVAEGRVWSRPALARPAWSYGGECRVIIKERVNPWGERVVREIRRCD
jgi:hypothetical protein